MADQSFREILSQFLEEKSSNPSARTQETTQPQHHPPYETASFFWQQQQPQPHVQKSKYAHTQVKRQTQASPPPPVKPTRPEVKWQITELDPAEKRQIQSLVQMGAQGFLKEISLTTLKKEYRRLARAYHPDTAPTEEGDRFRELQTIYDKLNRSLKRRLNGSAGDSESASAQESRRQDAA